MYERRLRGNNKIKSFENRMEKTHLCQHNMERIHARRVSFLVAVGGAISFLRGTHGTELKEYKGLCSEIVGKLI